MLLTVATINFQGSRIGSPIFIVSRSDLHSKYTENIVVKYADDTFLFLGSSMRATIGVEFSAVEKWSVVNNLLHLNQRKTQENRMVVGAGMRSYRR